MEKLRAIAQLFTELARASVSALHLRRGKPLDAEERGAEGQLEEQFSLSALNAVRELLNQICRDAEITDRASVGRVLQRLLARSSQVLHRFSHVIAAAVMMRQFIEMVVDRVFVQYL